LTSPEIEDAAKVFAAFCLDNLAQYIVFSMVYGAIQRDNGYAFADRELVLDFFA